MKMASLEVYVSRFAFDMLAAMECNEHKISHYMCLGVEGVVLGSINFRGADDTSRVYSAE